MKSLDEVESRPRSTWWRSRGLWSALLAMVTFFVARFALEAPGLGTSARIAIALVPVPFCVRRVSDGDELERRIQLEGLAVAFPLTLFLVMLLGLLQIAVPLPPEDWSYRHIWPFLFAFYVVGIQRARRRYE